MSSGAAQRILVASLCWVALTSLACGGSSVQKNDGATDDAAGAASAAGATGAAGAGGASGLTSCGAACQKYVSVCGAQDCTIDCTVQYMVFEEAACDREFDAYFRCVAALPGTQIQCDKDFLSFVDAQKCPAEFMALNLCRSTKGADCAPEPAFDDSCSVTNKPPHFQFCKVGVQPPTECVTYGVTGWFCCP